MPRYVHPSLTAAYVGYLTSMVGRQPGLTETMPPGAVDATVKLLRAAGLLAPWAERLLSRDGLRRLVAAIESRTAPGQGLEVALRRRLVEDETRDAMVAGVSQVLCLGAGFDTLCARLAAEYPTVTFWELDHPGTALLKNKALAKLGWSRDNLRLLRGDLLGLDLPTMLEQTEEWRRDAPSMVIAEGVAMYLPKAVVERLFDSVARIARPGSIFVFSYVLADERGKPLVGQQPWIVRSVLKLAGEPLRWGCAAETLIGELQRRGLEPDAPIALDLHHRYLDPLGISAPQLGVERCMVARRA